MPQAGPSSSVRGRLCRAYIAAAGLLCLVWLSGACESASHENIDRWMHTERGPTKLETTVVDASLALELRAHAARNLVRMGRLDAVVAQIAALESGDRAAVLEFLVPRLWDDARILGEMTKPTADQVEAKDALFDLRALASEPVRRQIDSYLIEWLTGGYYSGRASSGRIRGATIVRTIGPGAAPPLLDAANEILHAAADPSGARPKFEDPLLLGLAATGTPGAVSLLLDLSALGGRDPSLPTRAIDALYRAYVDSGGLFPVLGKSDVGGLAGTLDRMATLAQADDTPDRMVDDLVDLMVAAGPEHCVAPLLTLVKQPHRRRKHYLVSANAALRCAAHAAIVPVMEALPTAQPWSQAELRGALWQPIVALMADGNGGHQRVTMAARQLLHSKSWVARITGVELLATLGDAGHAAAVGALSRDRTLLRGWWGDQNNLPKGERKPPLRLGSRASAVASALARSAESG